MRFPDQTVIRSDCAAVQADLELHCLFMPEGTSLYDMLQFIERERVFQCLNDKSSDLPYLTASHLFICNFAIKF